MAAAYGYDVLRVRKTENQSRALESQAAEYAKRTIPSRGTRRFFKDWDDS
jgi:hypothetical protein